MKAMATAAMVVAGVLAGGCAPNTIIRRTALINAPQAPTREGMPLDKGDVRIEAHLDANTAHQGDFFLFEPNVAEVGDPGVLIPDLQIGASVWAGLPAGLEFGGQIYYASMGWASPNLSGVLPFPKAEEEDLLMGGLGLRLNIDVKDPRLALAMMAEVNVASIPEAIFECTDSERCSSNDFSNDLDGRELYTFQRVDHETFFLPNLALQFGWRFGDIPGVAAVGPDGQPLPADPDRIKKSLMPFISLGVQSSVTNTGFEPDASTLPEDTLKALWVGYLSFGVDATIDKLVLGASWLLPIEGEDAIDFGMVFNFRVGAQL